MRKTISTILAFVLVLGMFAPVGLHAHNPITITISGTPIDFEGQSPVIIDGHTLVPVRIVFEALGFDVDWYQPTQTVTLTRGDYFITISIGSNNFFTNATNHYHLLVTPAQIINGSTMLPIRAVLESVGYHVDWNQATNTITINRLHIMQAGDTLWGITQTHLGDGARFSEILEANNITERDFQSLMPGTKLIIPIPGPARALEIRQNSIHAGAVGSYVIMADNTVWLWGGFHDEGRWTARPEPIMVAENAAAVAEGLPPFFEAYAMVLRQDGALVFYPAGKVVLEDVAAIVAPWWRYAITSDGKLWQVGFYETSRPTFLGDIQIDNIIYFATGIDYMLTLTQNNSLWGWFNFTKEGSPFDLADWQHFEPTWIMDDIAAISTSGAHTLALDVNGTLWAWGNNRHGSLGNGTTEDRHSPVQIMQDVTFIATGAANSFAITSDSTLWAWGNNTFGQLGDGTTENRCSPVQIMQNVVEVASGGGNHTLAVTADGTLWTWGLNTLGQLGDGTTENRYSPVRIMDGVRVLQ